NGAVRGTRRFLARLERLRAKAPGRPLFLFYHTYEVHSPYRPPVAVRRALGIPLELPPASSRFLVAHANAAAALPPGTVANLLRLYDGDLRTTDDALRWLFAALERQGLLANTLVIVTADHGEEFGEHGGLLHRGLLYDELLHVPLIVVAPGVPPGRVRQM